MDDLEDVLTSYNEGQIENDDNASMLFTGLSGTGKGHTSGWSKEHALTGDHAKLFELHASKTSHLAEIFQFLLPNGFFLNRESKQILESVKTELEKGSYRDPELDARDIDEILELCESGKPPERMEKIDEFLEKESNHTLCQRLQEAREKQQEIQDRLMQIHKWGYTNSEIPDLFRKNYTGSLNESFNIRVFTPISRNMPTCEVPDFFEPFGVPADAFERYEELSAALKVIHPDRFEQYKNFYGRVVSIGDTSLQDLKNIDELNESDHYVEREFGDGQTYIDTRVQNEKNIREKFQRDWDGTFTEGVACSSDFEFKLRGRLKEAMLDDDVDIITLYTGFLSDHTLRKFVITYFMEIMFDIARNLSGKEVRNLDRAFIASMIEAQDVVEISNKENSLTSADRVFNKYLWERLNDARHENFHFWFDTKPAQTHKLLLSKIPRRVITQLNKEDRQSWYQGEKKRTLEKVFNSGYYTSMDGSYPEFGTGFLYDDEVVEWEDKYGIQKYGHRLPCPRMCVHDPVDEFSNGDWSFFIEELGMDSMRFDSYQEALFKEDWEKNAEPYVEERQRKEEEKRKEEEEEEQTKKEMRKSVACSKLEAKVREKGEVPSTWSSIHEEVLSEMKDEEVVPSDFKVRTIENYTKDLRRDLEENFDKGGADDLDVYAIADELKREVRNGEPALVYRIPNSKDKKKRFAKRYILENYDVEQEVAEDVAEDAAKEAILDLQMDGILDEHLHPQEDFEDPDEYREIMGMNQRDLQEKDEVVGVDEESAEEESGDEPEPPGEEWLCTCGALNEGDRTVCRNPSCTKSYEEVEEETERSSN